MSVHKCPVCRGDGTLFKKLSMTLNKVVCHGCNGKGWVSTDDNKTTRVPENNPDVLDWIEKVRE